ncbi:MULTISPECIES: SAF domain-containing protein [Nocardia]|uniref:SAF domain-containing protein n=1 Tax=Nocardia implantans TaxID=3108168 RepID=A0ABU6B0T2_9NOCA|nr:MULTISPECIES: SAF domain-containing protein [unclassified Nocardia]MBF6195317.1 flagellar biosynthesis protein FlgA [Nocardia beijingensis]MEA3528710.1 SAF domain-containing protein [Nocardia sp. CDC192]MEB3513236.1 SAF domain-containing protein [Nocardia sp. CDC186]
MTRALADLGRGGWNPAGWQRPPWADAVLLRRLLAAALTALAAFLFLRGDPGTERTTVLVAARDLAPGRLLESGDLRAAPREAGTLPAGAVTDPAVIVGATLAGAMRRGEMFTDLRVVGPRLAAAAAGAREARIVPVRLADTAVADILRAGDRVDVIGAEDAGGAGARPARTLATDAAVVLVSGGGTGRAAAERVVLVAMDAEHATAVAGASLRTALTVVFH